ncbi:hypothetical protein SDC9_212877 [bioreactor metagenome]|uniref:Uncharacterized protein n=1 Tax=bioreactor metagenome TaxID=1076179 RepID=A0A645JN61_9ZZZZ
MGGVFQAIVKTRPWRAFFKFSVKFIGKGRGVYQNVTSRKNYLLAFCNWHLKIPGNIQVLLERISVLHILNVLHALIPVGLVHKVDSLVELHEKFGITIIHTGADSILHFAV